MQSESRTAPHGFGEPDPSHGTRIERVQITLELWKKCENACLKLDRALSRPVQFPTTLHSNSVQRHLSLAKIRVRRAVLLKSKPFGAVLCTRPMQFFPAEARRRNSYNSELRSGVQPSVGPLPQIPWHDACIVSAIGIWPMEIKSLHRKTGGSAK